MIRTINIKLNAAHPELPLVEATTFTGAPSSVFIRGVPKNCGNWSITAVNVAVTYPDNATTTRAAVESAEGVWVATIPGTATSGRTVAGFRILADGIDENGAAVAGYVLGFADFAALSFFPVPAPGETFFYLRYFDTMPTTAKKMDVTAIDGILKYYNGTAWLPFADLTNYYTKAETDNAIERVIAYDNTVTPTSGNGVKSSGIWSAIWGALSALPSGFTSLYDWCMAQLAEVVHKTGDETIAGNKTFYGGIAMANGADIEFDNGGRVIIRTMDGSVAILNHDGIDYSTDGGLNYVHFDWPSASGTLALTSAIPYALADPIVVATAQSEVVEGETVYYGAATLADRTANIVQVTAATALDELRITFPAATSGKVRDFGLRVEIGTGSAALAAPALVPIAPPAETIKIENADGTIPALADATATAKGVTLLYFSETAPGVFVVKGEQVEEVA